MGRTEGGFRRAGGVAITLIVLAASACARGSRPPAGVPAPYLTTRDQAAHELVKTEQFIVPVGTVVRVAGLQFEGPSCMLMNDHKQILQQVFNALEEITENTVNDQDAARVAEHRMMEFEVRGHAAGSGHPDRDEAAALQCAQVARSFLTNFGTPPWRLKATAVGPSPAGSNSPRSARPQTGIRVEFVRIK